MRRKVQIVIIVIILLLVGSIFNAFWHYNLDKVNITSKDTDVINAVKNAKLKAISWHLNSVLLYMYINVNPKVEPTLTAVFKGGYSNDGTDVAFITVDLESNKINSVKLEHGVNEPTYSAYPPFECSNKQSWKRILSLFNSTERETIPKIIMYNQGTGWQITYDHRVNSREYKIMYIDDKTLKIEKSKTWSMK